MLIKLKGIVNLLSPLRVQLSHSSLTVTYIVVIYHMRNTPYLVLGNGVFLFTRENERPRTYIAEQSSNAD